jgi:hypothetical protein
VEEAEAYTFRLYKAGNEGQVLVERTLSDPSFTLEDFTILSRGDFIWRVEPLARPADGPVRRGPATENRFTVNLPPVSRTRLEDLGTLYGEE